MDLNTMHKELLSKSSVTKQEAEQYLQLINKELGRVEERRVRLLITLIHQLPDSNIAFLRKLAVALHGSPPDLP